jgi:hypothetical protein
VGLHGALTILAKLSRARAARHTRTVDADDWKCDPDRMDRLKAPREQYLVMKARATKAALTVEGIADPEMRSIVHGTGTWSSDWVEEWERAHPDQVEHST